MDQEVWVLAGYALLGAIVLYIVSRLRQHQPFSVLTAFNITVDSSASPGWSYLTH